LSLEVKVKQTVESFSGFSAVVGWPWLDARCPPMPLYHSPSSSGAEKIRWKACG